MPRQFYAEHLDDLDCSFLSTLRNDSISIKNSRRLSATRREKLAKNKSITFED